jgi:hypothetical protein
MTKDIRSVTYDFLEQFQQIARPDQNANCRLTGLPEEGLVISHYRLIKVIAHTGTLVVCEAEDLKTGRLVAIKLRPTHVRLGEASEPNQECFLDDIEELRPSELNERDRAKAAGGFEHVVYRSEGHASRRRRWWLIASSVLVLGFLALFFGFDIAFYRAGPRSKPIDRVKDTGAIVLATPSNSTGDPAFDNLDLASDNSVHAHDSVRLPETNVLSKDQVSEILKKMNRSPDERLTPDLAEEICLRANARAVVTGSIAADGTQYKITIEALGCRTGQTLQAVEGRATDRAAVPELARVLTAQILDKLAK